MSFIINVHFADKRRFFAKYKAAVGLEEITHISLDIWVNRYSNIEQAKLAYEILNHPNCFEVLNITSPKETITKSDVAMFVAQISNNKQMQKLTAQNVKSTNTLDLKESMICAHNVPNTVDCNRMIAIFSGYGKVEFVIHPSDLYPFWRIYYDNKQSANDAVRDLYNLRIDGADIKVCKLPFEANKFDQIELTISGVLRLSNGVTLDLTPTTTSIPVNTS